MSNIISEQELLDLNNSYYRKNIISDVCERFTANFRKITQCSSILVWMHNLNIPIHMRIGNEQAFSLLYAVPRTLKVARQIPNESPFSIWCNLENDSVRRMCESDFDADVQFAILTEFNENWFFRIDNLGFCTVHFDRATTWDENDLPQLALAIQQFGYYLHLCIKSDDYEKERKQKSRYENALKATSARLSMLIDNIGSSILICDGQDDILYTNNQFCLDFQLPYSAVDIIGTSSSKIWKIAEQGIESKEGFAQYALKIQAEKNVVRGQTITLRDDTSLEYDFLPIFEQQAYLGSIWQFYDVSIYKNIENSLRGALIKEKELGKLKTQFMRMTSHEFRTPLTAIQTATETMYHYHDRIPPHEQKEMYTTILHQIQYMVNVMNDVLTMGNLDNQDIAIKPIWVNLKYECEKIIKKISVLQHDNQQIEFTANGFSFDFLIDPRVLKYILFNPLTNAIKYSPNGGIITLALDVDKSSAIFEIVDHGIGIEPADLENIYSSFYRGKNVENIPGMGLGLSILKRSVDHLGGRITINSEVGQGTTVKIVIPKSETEKEHEKDINN